MEKVIVWGTGNYYKNKEYYIRQRYDVIAYVSKNQVGYKDGKEILVPNEIIGKDYDWLFIMSHNYLFEIIDEVRVLNLPYEKIVLGENILPHTIEENQFMVSGSKLYLDENGEVIFECLNLKQRVTGESDWDVLKNLFVSSRHSFHNLSVLPVHRQFHYEQGKSISRYYVEKFLEKYRSYITGKVFEVGDRRYTSKYGINVQESWVIDCIDKQETGYQRVNLETGEGVEENVADCLIATSVLGVIFDIWKVTENIVKMLKKGGIALVTTNGTAPISRYDAERWGYYWKFTDGSMRKLFERLVGEEQVIVETYGNVKTCSAYLYGIPAEQLTEDELNYSDSDYQVILATIIRK